MSRLRRRVLIQNFQAAQASAAEPVDTMDWEPTLPEDLLPHPAPLAQPAPEASHQQDQPGVSQATVPVNDVVEDTYPQHLPICPPNPIPFVSEPVPERPRIYPEPKFMKPRRPFFKPLLSGPGQQHPANLYRAPPVSRTSFVEQLTSKKHRQLPPISNRQAYFRNTAEPSKPWNMRKQAEDITMRRRMAELRNQSTPRRGNNPSPCTPSRSATQSTTSPNSRKRRIEAVDGYAHDEHRASRDGQGEHDHKQQAAAQITAIPESPIDTSMVDAPPYEGSLLQASPVHARTGDDISQIQRTPQHMPGTWPVTPVSVRQIAIPPTEIFHLSEGDVYTRDQVALMSGALAGYRRTSSQGMVVQLSDGNVIPPSSPEHAYELQRQFSYWQDILQGVSDAYYPILRVSRFTIEAVGNRVRRTCREFVQGAVEVAGSAKRRAVAICDKVAPEFVRRRITRQQQDTRNLRRASSTERHRLKARKLGMGQKKQGSSSPQVTLDEYEDVTPPPPPRDMPASGMIDYYRLPKEKIPTQTLPTTTTTTTTKDGIAKGAKVQKKRLSDKAKSKTKTSRKLAQLSQEDVNKAALPRAPRRGELIKGAWPNAIPPSEAALRAYHESFAKLRSRPIEEMSGMPVPEPENWPPRPQLAPTTPPSSPPPTELPLPAEELTCQSEASVETEAPEPPKEGPSPSSPEYEGFMTSPPRPRRETKEVHWLESESPMGRPISSVRAYDPLSRVTPFQPHESTTAEESGRPAPEPMDNKTPADHSVQHDQPLLRSPEVPYVKHLTANWEAKVDRAMALSDKSEVGTTLRGDPLTRKSLNTCYTKLEWLNDEVINAYLELIVDHARQEAGNSGRHDKPKYHAFSTYFFSNLRDKGYESVRRWATRAKIGGEKLLGVETVFVPIHDRSHWTLMVVRPAARTIEHFDSLGSPSLGHIATAKEWLRGELGDLFVEEEWRVLPSISPQQNNGNDCGVFLLTTAKLVSLGKPLRYGARDIPEIRKRIVAELMNGGFFGDFDPKKDEIVPVRSML
ncbi:hypothetical protein EMPG_11178 [Blastomyces silverae]|uniref:Ubiquitin-like protease family profile domain-containing protein n=1 Tax=Blastomyces silverae TaxID=2060906 RepID=A0A0H1B7X2_9EURO|nr:hypothetical protein EMPG_11178 [Blastomyces silverae]